MSTVTKLANYPYFLTALNTNRLRARYVKHRSLNTNLSIMEKLLIDVRAIDLVKKSAEDLLSCLPDYARFKTNALHTQLARLLCGEVVLHRSQWRRGRP